jgi:indolepyruvate decarboxylase
MHTARFITERLENAGVRHVFAVPGDYVLELTKELCNSQKIKLINNTDEAHAGFAADGYARVNGIGCVVVTYSVGASKVINAVQCAYAERSPLVVISGAPGTNERDEPFLLHHMVRHFNSQKKMFDEITCYSVVLDDPAKAGYQIDKAFEALHHYKQPIYIELPRDMAKKSITYDVYKQGTPTTPPTDPENLAESIQEVSDWLAKAKSPAILAGVEVARYKVSESMVKFAEKHNIPVATTLLGKSVINERSPVFAGVYFGSGSNEHTRKIVDDSDCLFILGDCYHDMTLCFRPAKFKKRQIVSASVESLQVRNHTFTNVGFVDFCKALFKTETLVYEDVGISDVEPKKVIKRWSPELPPVKDKITFSPKLDTKITSDRLFSKINSVLGRSHAICADIGDSLFGAMDLTVHHSHHFLSDAFYTSMGTSIPYALGVQLACPEVRPIVIIGDGAFQMVGTDLSTILQFKCNPIVFVLNNDGYTTERFLLDGAFNDIRRWQYHKITELIGGGKGVAVSTEEELEVAVKDALDSKELFVINVMLAKKDISQGLKRMTDGLSKRI